MGKLLVAKPRAEQVPPPTGILPFGHFLGNDHPHAFARLGEDYLDAAKVLHTAYKGEPKCLYFRTLFKHWSIT